MRLSGFWDFCLLPPRRRVLDPRRARSSSSIRTWSPRTRPRANRRTSSRNSPSSGCRARWSSRCSPTRSCSTTTRCIEAMLPGDVHLAAPSLSKFEAYHPQAPDLRPPVHVQDIAAVDRSSRGRRRSGDEGIDGEGGRLGLDSCTTGMKQMSANKSVVVPPNAAGMKIRMQPSDVISAQMEALSDALPKPWPSPRSTARCRPGHRRPGEHLVEHVRRRSSTRCRTAHRVQPRCARLHGRRLGGVLDDSLPDDIRTEVRRLSTNDHLRGADRRRDLIEPGAQTILDSGGAQIRRPGTRGASARPGSRR